MGNAVILLSGFTDDDDEEDDDDDEEDDTPQGQAAPAATASDDDEEEDDDDDDYIDRLFDDFLGGKRAMNWEQFKYIENTFIPRQTMMMRTTMMMRRPPLPAQHSRLLLPPLRLSTKWHLPPPAAAAR